MTNAKKLRTILEETKYLVLPGVYDCLSAKLAENAGAKAIFLSGGALSMANLGRPDIGFLGLPGFLDAIQKINASVRIPLIADADNGFGNAIHAADAAKKYMLAGAAGLQIDDQVLPQINPSTAKEKLAWENVAHKIRAIRKSTGPDFVIIFRTIANMTDGIDEAIKRINLAAEVGADYCYVEAIKTKEDLVKVSQEATVDLLVNMNESAISSQQSIDFIKSLNFKIGLYPVTSLGVAAKAMDTMFHNLIATESTSRDRNNLYTPPEVFAAMNLSEIVDI